MEKTRQNKRKYTKKEDTLCNRCKKKVEQERLQEIEDARIEKEIEAELTAVKTEENFKRVARKKWPQEVFKSVNIIKENILAIKDARALIIEKGLEKDQKLLKQLNAQINAAKEVEKLTAGSVALITSNSSFNLMTGHAKGEEIPENAKTKIIIGVINKEEGLTKIIKKVIKKPLRMKEDKQHQ